MLTIRLQRTGRKGYAHFRVVVQDVRQSPSSGKVIASLGTYDPHTKEANIDTEKAKFYIKNGVQPSSRVATLLKKAGVKLPAWVELDTKKKKAIKHPEKLRKNRPSDAETVEAKPAEPKEEELTEPKEEKPVDKSAAKESLAETEPTTKEAAEPTKENLAEEPATEEKAKKE